MYLEVGMLWCVRCLCFLPYVKDQILSRILGRKTTAKCAGSISAHLFRMHCTSMQTALELWFLNFCARLCHQQWMLFLEVVLLLIQHTILNFCCIGLVASLGLNKAYITPLALLIWKGQTLWSFVRQWVTMDFLPASSKWKPIPRGLVAVLVVLVTETLSAGYCTVWYTWFRKKERNPD